MPLSDKEILAAREHGDIIIEPFDPRQLGTDSYDVRLGEFFYRERKEHSEYNIFDLLDTQRIWVPYRATPFQETAICYELPNLKPQDLVILLQPGETILAHTQEFVGARRNYTTQMHARSSAGRSMVGVCKCAGKGDVGFFNRWTMEITSFSRFHTIPLKVDMRIAQIDFMPVGETQRVYGTSHGKYQGSDDLQVVMRAWHPEMMLPRFHADWELKP